MEILRTVLKITMNLMDWIIMEDVSDLKEKLLQLQEEMNILTDIQKDAIKAYSAVGGQEEEDYDYSDSELFNIIDPLVSRNPKMILYRGFGIDESELDDFFEYDWTPDSSILEEGLLSWTNDMKRAYSFGSGEIHVVYEVEITNYLDIRKYSLYDEGEFLTSNLEWRVESTEMIRPGSWIVKGKQI